MGSSPLWPLCREGSDPGPPTPGRCAATLVLTTLGFTPLPCCRDWPGLQGVGLGASSARPAWRFCLLTALANTLSRDSANYFWAAKRHSSYFSRSSMTLHFFGWLDRKPGTCSGSSRFAACKRQPPSVLAAPPRPSSVPPPRLRAHTEAPGLQVAQETSPRLFLAPVLARGLPAKSNY